MLCSPEGAIIGEKFGLWNQKENCTRNKGIELNYIIGLYLYHPEQNRSSSGKFKNAQNDGSKENSEQLETKRWETSCVGVKMWTVMSDEVSLDGH